MGLFTVQFPSEVFQGTKALGESETYPHHELVTNISHASFLGGGVAVFFFFQTTVVDRVTDR